MVKITESQACFLHAEFGLSIYVKPIEPQRQDGLGGIITKKESFHQGQSRIGKKFRTARFEYYVHNKFGRAVGIPVPKWNHLHKMSI